MDGMASKGINPFLIRIFVSLFIFFFVFSIPLDYSLNKYGGTYVHRPDTSSYLSLSLSPSILLSLDPWKSARAPGYGLFLYAFLEPHKKELANAFKKAGKLPPSEVFAVGKRLPEFINGEGLQGVFDNIVLAQRLLLSIGAAFLVYACSLYINALVVGACFFLGVQVTPLVNVSMLLTESVAQPLSFFAVGLLLLYFKKRNFFLLFLAALCASALYLVRPAGIYMLGLGGICWFYFFWEARFRHVFKFLLAATGFLPAVAYIGYISLTSGHLFFGTHPQGSDLQFSSYYLQKEDMGNMPTLRSREYARIFLDKVELWKKENATSAFGPDFKEWPRTKSFGYVYNTTVWPLTYGPEGEVWAELAKNPRIGPLSLKEMVKTGRELKIGMLMRHTGDRIKTVGCNILAGLGYYRDYRSSSLWAYGLPLIMGAWGAWCLGLLLCPQVRFCLFLPGAAHLLHVFVISYGNFILPRYIDLTETLFIFAVFLSLWALGSRLWQFCGTTRPERRKEPLRPSVIISG
ncbi:MULTISPECIES: hypothetical protein [unclassified Desulfovibrio]|uniref:hypothetical protein n=1 Tax=unclassified Desulfovibrio TaxID=2593640 RepID=UPI0013ED9646|nr:MULTISPECIES: hypothetical protein [unclassified Desulfovibrio]